MVNTNIPSMDKVQEHASSSAADRDMSDQRKSLLERTIPRMQLGKQQDEFNSAVAKERSDVDRQQLSTLERCAMRFRVRGNAVLTGGAGTLALVSARALLEHGLSGLALLDLPNSLDQAHVQDQLSTLRRDFPDRQIITAAADVTDAAGLKDTVQSVRSQLGALDILCCFAGVVNVVCAEEMTADAWRKVVDVNSTGTWFAAQAVGKHMIEDGRGGRMVFIASISGHRVNYPQPQAAYNASKAAVLQMRSSLAAEWSGYGIRVNSVSPGYMDTILNEGDGLAPFREAWASRNPMGRMGDPQELTGPLVLLCSDVGGSYVNGTDLVVDGGGIVF